MSTATISYKGFTIKRWGAFYRIEKKIGNFSTLKDAKAYIDYCFDKNNKNKSTSFHK